MNPLRLLVFLFDSDRVLRQEATIYSFCLVEILSEIYS